MQNKLHLVTLSAILVSLFSLSPAGVVKARWLQTNATDIDYASSSSFGDYQGELDNSERRSAWQNSTGKWNTSLHAYEKDIFEATKKCAHVQSPVFADKIDDCEINFGCCYSGNYTDKIRYGGCKSGCCIENVCYEKCPYGAKDQEYANYCGKIDDQTVVAIIFASVYFGFIFTILLGTCLTICIGAICACQKYNQTSEETQAINQARDKVKAKISEMNRNLQPSLQANQ